MQPLFFVIFKLHRGKEIISCWETGTAWEKLYFSCRGELSNISLAIFGSSYLSSPEDNWLRSPVFFPGKTQSAVLKGHQEVATGFISFCLPVLFSVLGTFLVYLSLHQDVMSQWKVLFLITLKELAILERAKLAILERAIAFGILACYVASFLKGQSHTYMQGIYILLRFRFGSTGIPFFFLLLLSPAAIYKQLPSHNFHHNTLQSLYRAHWLCRQTSFTVY